MSRLGENGQNDCLGQKPSFFEKNPMTKFGENGQNDCFWAKMG